MNYADNGDNITQDVLNNLAPFGVRLPAAYTLDMFRVVMVPDESYNIKDLMGDCYNPEVNPEIEVTTLKRQERAFKARVNREGVWAILVQCRALPSLEWVDVESIWGFVGRDAIGSGYEQQLCQAADDWLAKNADLLKLQTALKYLTQN